MTRAKSCQTVSQRECLLSVPLHESKTDPLGGLIHTAYNVHVVDGTLSCILFHFCFGFVLISCVLVWFVVFSSVSLLHLSLRFVVFSLFCCVLLRFIVFCRVFAFCSLVSLSCVEFSASFFNVLSVLLSSILFLFVVFC